MDGLESHINRSLVVSLVVQLLDQKLVLNLKKAKKLEISSKKQKKIRKAKLKKWFLKT